jgi:hypothetical protein
MDGALVLYFGGKVGIELLQLTIGTWQDTMSPGQLVIAAKLSRTNGIILLFV